MFAKAMVVWQDFYSGAIRPRRRDVGCPRKLHGGKGKSKPSLAGWLEDRNVKIGRLAKGQAKRKNSGPLEDVRAPEMWTDRHEKELNFTKEGGSLQVILSQNIRFDESEVFWNKLNVVD